MTREARYDLGFVLVSLAGNTHSHSHAHARARIYIHVHLSSQRRRVNETEGIEGVRQCALVHHLTSSPPNLLELRV